MLKNFYAEQQKDRVNMLATVYFPDDVDGKQQTLTIYVCEGIYSIN